MICLFNEPYVRWPGYCKDEASACSCTGKNWYHGEFLATKKLFYLQEEYTELKTSHKILEKKVFDQQIMLKNYDARFQGIYNDIEQLKKNHKKVDSGSTNTQDQPLEYIQVESEANQSLDQKNNNQIIDLKK